MLALFYRETKLQLIWWEERSRVLLAALAVVEPGPARGQVRGADVGAVGAAAGGGGGGEAPCACEWDMAGTWQDLWPCYASLQTCREGSAAQRRSPCVRQLVPLVVSRWSGLPTCTWRGRRTAPTTASAS